MNLYELCASLKLDTSQYESGLANASSSTSSFGGKIGNGLASACKVGAVAVTAVATATTAVAGAMAKGVADTAAYGDAIDKNSQKMGISAQAYQEWDAVLQHSGTSMDSMGTAFKTLANKAQDGSDAFQKLGISAEEAASMSTEELWSSTIAGLQNMEEGTERTALASELLGKGATELGALFNTSAEDTQAMIDKVNELGGVMSDESVSAAAAYQDSLQNLQTAFGGLKNKMMADFLPSITSVMDGLSAVLSGDKSGVEQIKEGIRGFAEQISETLPEIINVVSEVLPVIVDAIMENLPLLVDAGVQLIVALAQGLLGALPQLVEHLPEIIVCIVSALITLAPQLLQAGYELVKVLGEGLASGVGMLADKAGELVEKIKGKFNEKVSEFKNIGKNIVNGIKDGFVEAFEKFKAKVDQLVGKLIDGVKGILGIHSPSKVFAQIGGYMAEGMGEGWGSEFKDVQKTINKNLDFSAKSISTSPMSLNGFGSGAIYNQTINVNDQIATADELAQKIRIESRYGLMRGVALG